MLTLYFITLSNQQITSYISLSNYCFVCYLSARNSQVRASKASKRRRSSLSTAAHSSERECERGRSVCVSEMNTSESTKTAAPASASAKDASAVKNGTSDATPAVSQTPNEVRASACAWSCSPIVSCFARRYGTIAHTRRTNDLAQKTPARKDAAASSSTSVIGKRFRKSFGSRFFWGSVIAHYVVIDALFYKVRFDDGDVDILPAPEVLEDIKMVRPCAVVDLADSCSPMLTCSRPLTFIGREARARRQSSGLCEPQAPSSRTRTHSGDCCHSASRGAARERQVLGNTRVCRCPASRCAARDSFYSSCSNSVDEAQTHRRGRDRRDARAREWRRRDSVRPAPVPIDRHNEARDARL